MSAYRVTTRGKVVLALLMILLVFLLFSWLKPSRVPVQESESNGPETETPVVVDQSATEDQEESPSPDATQSSEETKSDPSKDGSEADATSEPAPLDDDLDLLALYRASGSVYFEKGQTTLDPNRMGELEDMIAQAKFYPNLKIGLEVSALIDDTQSDQNVSWSIAKMRAQAVIDEMVKQGIKKERIIPTIKLYKTSDLSTADQYLGMQAFFYFIGYRPSDK